MSYPVEYKEINMNMKKTAKKVAGVALMTAGVAAKLTKWGLNASDIVLSGANNLADSFAPAPKLGIGKAAFSAVQKGVSDLEQKLLKKGKEWTK